MRISLSRIRIRSAFSLLELLAVVTIIGIIAVVVIPRVGTSTVETKKNSCVHYISDINSAIERYRFDNSNMSPTSLDDLTAVHYPIGIPPCPRDGSLYVIDPATGRIAPHNH